MKYFTILMFIAFLLQGCGGGDGSSSAPELVSGPIEDRFFNQQWYFDWDNSFYTQNSIENDAHINPEKIHSQFTGKGIRIAVIDDALDVIHEDLAGAIDFTFDVASRTGDVSHSAIDGFHGTAVTGIIAARANTLGIRGIASGCEIIFLKHGGRASDSQLIEMFNKAENLGADIINCSWSTGNVSESVKDVIVDLATHGRNGKGIVIVFSAGNNNSVIGDNDESAIPEVIAVGSSDETGLRAFYSNFGPNLDLLAPGGHIWGIATLDPMGHAGISTRDDNYLLYDDIHGLTGTSASTAIVSGSIAILLEINPSLSRTQITAILKNSSDKVGFFPYNEGRNDYYGYGKVNLSKAAALAQGL